MIVVHDSRLKPSNIRRFLMRASTSELDGDGMSDDLERSDYFLRIPVSVFERLFTAPFAAGVFTDGEADDLALGLVWLTPRLFPVVAWFSALDVFGPGEPPVPFRVLPFERVLPAAPPEPVAAPALEPAAPPAPLPELLPVLCASANE